MPRKATVRWDETRKGWVTSALGEERIDASGKPYRAKTWNRDIPRNDKLAAQAWLHGELVKRAEARKAAAISLAEPTFRDVSGLYLEAKDGRLSVDAHDRAFEHLTRFGEWPGKADPGRFDARPARRITPAEVRRFLDALAEGGASPSYLVDGILKTVKACFAWAARVDPGLHPGLPLPENPLAGFQGPEKPRRKHRRIDPGAIDAILAWANARAGRMPGLQGRFGTIAAILLETLRATGARPKELCVAEWSEWNVRPDGLGVIVLPPEKWKNGRKTKRSRIVVVPPAEAARIEWIKALPGRHPTHIFTHRRGRGRATAEHGTPEAGDPWVRDARTGNTKGLQTWFYRLLNQARAEAVPVPDGFRLYWFRSAFATEARRKGVHDPLIAHGMGTSVGQLERSYSDLDEEDAIRSARAIAGDGPPR